MTTSNVTISWAPRVSRQAIFRLYTQIARGIYDDALIDEVAYAFFCRCEDIVRINERRFACPACREELPHPHPWTGVPLTCARCGWSMAWREFAQTYKRKQMTGAYGIVDRFVQKLPRCRTAQEKMQLIDDIIHEAHEGIKGLGGNRVYKRPVAMNLIDGKLDEVVQFLENLPYGPGEGLSRAAKLAEWRRKCFACGDVREEALAQVRRLVEGMPQALRQEIEELVASNKVQRARAKLAETDEYSGRVGNLKGPLAQQIVRMIQLEMREREREGAGPSVPGDA